MLSPTHANTGLNWNSKQLCRNGNSYIETETVVQWQCQSTVCVKLCAFLHFNKQYILTMYNIMCKMLLQKSLKVQLTFVKVHFFFLGDDF